MGKVIFWIVVVFAVLFALRLYGAAKARARRAGTPRKEADAADAPMVRCVNCGVYLPKSEALPAPTGFRCGAPECAKPR